MQIAYLTNRYPKVSHTFIRREIRALERLGLRVARFSIRQAEAGLVDAVDVEEEGATQVVLAHPGWGTLARAFFRVASSPLAFLRAAWLAMRCGVCSDAGLLRHGAYLIEAVLLVELLRLRGARHLHAHMATNPAMVAMLCRELGGASFSFTAHGPEPFDKPKMIRIGEKIRRASFVIGVSHFGVSQLRRWAPPGSEARIHLVHCGLDASWFDDEPSPPPEDSRLVFVGRLHRDKAPLEIVEVCARLAGTPREFDLVIVGDGELQGAVEQAVAELGVRERIRLTGRLDQRGVCREIERARALVSTSYAEGLPLVLMEAFARGRPVIATAVGGVPELVADGVNGWLVPPGSTVDLQRAVEEALTAPTSRLAEMAGEGRRRVLERHRVETEVEALAALFRAASGPGFRASGRVR